MNRLRALTLVLTLAAGAFILPAGHATATCDPYDTRLCTDGKAPDGTTTAVGGVDKTSYMYDRCYTGDCRGFGIGGGGGSSTGQDGPAQQPPQTHTGN